ncbi:hypothetical protein [Stenotrophomonas indicatrix]|jgi:hypothetical protein|uniref:hypothetical protein n=1 Tax=Stenotrophomonas indicatrix TaxID=2045451 RepID=UPI0004719468|nr:hypothetical protein [Stenotrophomonas indicatrix]
MGKKMEVSTPALAAIVAVSFCAGAAAVWFSVGLSWGLPGDDTGSKADWAAAYGAWVIGLGALALTAEAHRRSVVSADKEEREREERRKAAINAVIDKANTCLRIDRAFRNAEKDGKPNFGSGYVAKGTVRALVAATSSFSFDSEDYRILDRESAIALRRLVANIVQFQLVADMFLGDDDVTHDCNPNSNSFLVGLSETAGTVKGNFAKFEQLAEELRDRTG